MWLKYREGRPLIARFAAKGAASFPWSDDPLQSVLRREKSYILCILFVIIMLLPNWDFQRCLLWPTFVFVSFKGRYLLAELSGLQRGWFPFALHRPHWADRHQLGLWWVEVNNKTHTQQQRPESPTVPLTWHASKYKVHKLHQRYIFIK